MSEIVLHVTSGQGPRECRWVVAQLAAAYTREAEPFGVVCEVLEDFDDHPASLLMRLTGDQALAFVAGRTGTILWIGESPFRHGHNRRNWFVGVALAPEPDLFPDLKPEDIDYQTLRASGPGGQHVNKTHSAVRATHRPTGLVATAQEQRSQQANRKLARLKLAMMIEEQRGASHDKVRRSQWSLNQQLERGNPVRTYTGVRFKPKSTI